MIVCIITTIMTISVVTTNLVVRLWHPCWACTVMVSGDTLSNPPIALKS